MKFSNVSAFWVYNYTDSSPKKAYLVSCELFFKGNPYGNVKPFQPTLGPCYGRAYGVGECGET